MTGKKKQVDFSVRPRKGNETLPADPEKWVRDGQGGETARGTDVGREKRLTLNLPAGLHTAFKGRCVLEGVTIQDKVRVLIERELTVERAASEGTEKHL
jgi:ParG